MRLGNWNELLLRRHATESLRSTGRPPAEDSCAGPCMLEAVGPDSCTAAGRGRGRSGLTEPPVASHRAAVGGRAGRLGAGRKEPWREGGRGVLSGRCKTQSEGTSPTDRQTITERALRATPLITGWNRCVAMATTPTHLVKWKFSTAFSQPFKDGRHSLPANH